MSANNMDTGTYEIIKGRLTKQGDDLKDRVAKLNSQRKDIFGAVETKLLSSERIITENNCVPRDMAPVDDRFLFGYNVHMGLKSKVAITDVFSVYRFTDGIFQKESLALIDDGQFAKDFDDLYRYYKNTFFAKFTITEPYLYMVFQTGPDTSDIKVFKWLMDHRGLTYMDGRSDHEVTMAPRNDFNFQRATRDHQRSGLHPHISVMDRVFVETLDGDLTIKVEDNTETGKGIYSEPVEDPDQTLDDADIAYADLGQLIILRILPYKEKDHRYFVFNDKLKSVVRIDSIKDTCMALPGSHGLIFPKGYYLQNGEYKVFDVPGEDCVFDQMISSDNGEDYQYIFYRPESGIYLIYTYNIIERSIDSPIVCSGYSHFADGEMTIFRHEAEPRKNHMLQIWQTPYVDKDHKSIEKHDSELYKIGNKDIVACMADCRGVAKLIDKGESYQSVYMDIVKESEQILDAYFWIDKSEAFNLAEVLGEIKETATFAIGEFEKVTRIKNSTAKQIGEVKEATEALLQKLTYSSFEDVSDYVTVLAEIRSLRGSIVSLRDLRYTDLTLIDGLDAQAREQNEAFSQRCVDFLMKPEGMKSYEERVDNHQSDIEGIAKSQEGQALADTMDATGEDLELLMDIVSNFKIEDPTVTTAIIEKISGLFSLLNNAKAKLKTKIEAFNKSEMTVQFNAQMKLLSQSVVNYMDLSDTEEKCDQYMNKVMVQLQELEGRFAEFDEYILRLDEKREEIYTAFETKKQTILDKRNKRLMALFQSSERIISGIANRIQAMDSAEAINGYLATDIMAEKVRDIIHELRQLGDSVKADEISAKLKTLRENTLRQLKDRQDLFVDGENVIKLGRHHFSVNTKAIDLSMVRRDEGMFYHISGTDFWHKVDSEALDSFDHVYGQSLPSENAQVYRGAFLAYSLFCQYRDGGNLDSLYSQTESQLEETVRKFMEPRYQEGYTKGVHDLDGTKLLTVLLDLHKNIDLLTYAGDVRAMARLYWHQLADEETKALLIGRLSHLSKVGQYFETAPSLDSYTPYLIDRMEAALSELSFFDNRNIPEAAMYLCEELMGEEGFAVSLEGKKTCDDFRSYLRDRLATDAFEQSLKGCEDDLEGRFYLVREWLTAYWMDVHDMAPTEVLEEVMVILMEDGPDEGRIIPVSPSQMVTGLVGSHTTIEDGGYLLTYTDFMAELTYFNEQILPDYSRFQDMKKDLIAAFKHQLHLEDFRPQVLTSFVRNKLIDEVYLPLVGDNLAKQMGVVGADKRTDLMGLLLLVSPPGYGKTTLMEYIASRLGIILVKVNGPSLGNDVTSLDPEKAGHSSAREELRKLNLALKMGNNVMIYLDDIQHCHPEFLQKFISLCDGQRKIEGVYDGKGQTYDLRGKKVAVVMAGNPYTESGEKFKIPDMLANRADVYNLGDMLRENEEAFRLSYIENSLTSNPVLQKLTRGNTSDLYGLVSMAQGADRESVTFESEYSVDELNEYTEVLQKLFTVRDMVLKTNMAYIQSAAQADDYRKEPPFKLQGSYRNMNRIAEKVVSIMNEDELFGQVIASYENDCQTLTTGAEANMLKWKEINNCLSATEEDRYQEIKSIYMRNKVVKGDDKVGQAVAVLSDLTDNIGMIKGILDQAYSKN